MADAAYNSGSHPCATGKFNNNSSRRASLGLIAMGAAAVPSLAMAGTMPTPGPYAARWAAAMNRMARAEAAHDAACDATEAAQTRFFAARRDDMTLEEKQALRRATGCDMAHEREDRASSASLAARKALLACPAPDHAALVRKLELAIEWELDGGEFIAMIADVRRLGGLA